ncbi:MAG: hypothetical protein JSS10_04595 [Verrucomicrobia bacterium]|nr:hypothetical protein [Verrucomicrobiota bacterium]
MADPIFPTKRHLPEPSDQDKTVPSPKKIPKESPKENETVLTEGPFKGLPVPFQNSDYQSSMPYISCNEEGQDTSLGFMKNYPSSIPPDKRVHIGFGVWFNFDLIGSTKPAYAILCDIDNHVIDVYKAISERLTVSPNRFKFIEYFREYLMNNSEKLFGLDTLSEVEKIFTIENEANRPGSWLSSEQSYQVVRQLHSKRKILFLRLNITDDRAVFMQIAKWMNENKLELDTLYVANIIEWIPQKLKQQAYLENLRTISSANTRFIQAHKPENKGSPIQFCSIGVNSIQVPVKKSRKYEREK